MCCFLTIVDLSLLLRFGLNTTLCLLLLTISLYSSPGSSVVKFLFNLKVGTYGFPKTLSIGRSRQNFPFLPKADETSFLSLRRILERDLGSVMGLFSLLGVYYHALFDPLAKLFFELLKNKPGPTSD